MAWLVFDLDWAHITTDITGDHRSREPTLLRSTKDSQNLIILLLIMNMANYKLKPR